jgi:type VI secretion system Hcp family effector
MRVKGTVQGTFTGETAAAGNALSRCLRYRFKGQVTNDPTRGKSLAARSHEPLVVVKPLGASTPQFLQAFWSSEVLSDVYLLLTHPDGDGHIDKEFQEIELTNATVASIEHVCVAGGQEERELAQEHEEIAFRFEAMTVKNVPGKMAAKYDWKNQG